MENIFENVFKQEIITTVTDSNVNDYLNNLTTYTEHFYAQKKLFGYVAIIAIAIALPFYKYTNTFLPKMMQKIFPNDLAFIVYCAALILMVGIPTIIWYNMDSNFKKSKINTLEALNYTVQSYFENGAKQLNVSLNFNATEYKQKDGNSDYDIYDYVKINTLINSVHYETRLFISTLFTMAYGRIPAKGRNGNTSKIQYYLYLETICAIPKNGNQQKEILYVDNDIQTKFIDAPTTFNYGFKTNGKIDANIENSFTKPFVKSYFDYAMLSVKK